MHVYIWNIHEYVGAGVVAQREAKYDECRSYACTSSLLDKCVHARVGICVHIPTLTYTHIHMRTCTETVKETIRNRLLADFILCMATCHTVMTQVCKRGNVSYNYSSPDEGALVRAAKNLQYDFTERSFDSITLHIFGTPTTYQVLNVNEFTSDRKRMSVLLRMPDGSIVLFCKGADEIVLPLLKSNSSGAYSTAFIERHLTRFGNAGLRTLVMCKKVVEEEEYQDWNTRYQAAKTSLERRDEKLGELAAEIERDMLLLGASAIEDKLQDGVPETISMLTEAGIKIWMLTGDKLETARNIGVSCRLLRQKMDILELQEARDRTRVLHQIVESLEKNEKFVGRTNENFALVVTGQCLTVILNDPDLKTLFEALCKMAKTVVACRVIPSQKAAIVRLIHEGCDNPMTLAIGDGANDVAMIQEARLGVGISGNEGMQAVRNSDYSFAQFRYLQKLLLVHGHWNYRRVSVLILYSFYKNICNVLTLFFYGFHNGFTGTTLYESYLGSGWNVGWTLFPILLFGAFDQDLKSSTILSHPSIYIGGQRGNEFNAFLMCLWLFRALLHAFLVYFLCYGVFLDTISSSDGKEIGLFAMGTMTNFCTVLVVTYEVGLATKYWTKWNVLGVVGSLLFWFFFVYVYSQMSAISPDFYGIAAIIFAKPLFWLLILLVPTTAILSDYAWIYYRSQYSPTPIDILREQELLGLLSQEEEEAGHEAASVLYDVMQKELEAELQAITRRSLYGEEADNELEDSYASDGDAVGGNKYTDEGHLNVARLASQIRASQSKSTSDKTSSQTVNAKLLSPDRGEGHSNSDGNDASGHARNDQDDMNQSAKERKERHDAAGLHSDSAPLLSKKADKPSLKFSAYSVVSQLEPYVQQAYTIAHDGTLRISPPVRNILVRLGHLQNVLKFNQKAVDKSRSKESPLNTSLLSTVRQHWLTLTFEPVVSGRVHERQCEAKGGRVGKSRQSPMYGNDTSGDTKGRAGKFVRPRLISARSLRHLKIESNYTSSTTVRKIDQEDLHLSSVSSAFAEGLEEEYTLVSTIKNMEFRRTSMLIICLVVVVYGSYATIIAEENYILRLVLSVVLVGVVGTMWTHGVLRYFHQLMMVGIFVGGITKTILITQNGTLGMGMYCISSFFLLRTSYVHAFAMTMIDLFFYSFWMRYQGYLTWNQLLRFLFMYTLLLLFSTMVARKLEMYTRIDFLLQKEYQIKRTRTQEVVDNMMPRYITNQISKLMNRRKRKTAKSRFNTLTSNVKTAGNLDQHQLHHHHHRHRASDGTKRNSLRSKTDDPNMLVTLDDSSVISDQQDSSSRGMSIGQGKDQRDRAALSATALGRSVTMAAKVALNRNHSLSPRQGGSFRGVRIPGPLSASANGGSSSSKSADYRGSIGSRGSVDTGKGGGVVVKGGPGAGSEESAGGADKKTGDDAGANDRAGTGTSTSSKACTQGSAVGSDNAHSKDTEKKDSESGGAVNTSETNTDSTSVGGASAEVKRAEPGEAEQKDPKNDCDDLGQMPSPSSAAALKTLKFLSQRPSALIIPPLPARVFLTPCATPTKDALIHRASFSPTQPMPSPPSFRSREGRVSDETHSGRADHTPVVNTNTSLVSDHLNSAAFSVMNQPVGVCLRSSAKCQSAKDEGKDRIETARGVCMNAWMYG